MAQSDNSKRSTKRNPTHAKRERLVDMALAWAEYADADYAPWPSVLTPPQATRAVAKARVVAPGVVAEVNKAGVSVDGIVALVAHSRPLTDDEVDEIVAFAYPEKIPGAAAICKRIWRLRAVGLLSEQLELPGEAQIERVRRRAHNRDRILRGRPSR
jgi:hypothetical protein